MKTAVFFKQNKPSTVVILGCSFIVLAVMAIFEDSTRLVPILTMLCISCVLLGYSISFEINKNYSHKRHYKLFGITIIKTKLDCFVPEYITVFSTRNTKSSDWGPVSAIGNQLMEQSYVVRMFKGKRHFTLWRTKSPNLAKLRAEELGALLEVKVHF